MVEPAIRMCPLCGGEVMADRDGCPSGCPVAKHCKVLCCPNCGYEFVTDSTLASTVGRLVSRFRRRP